MLKESNLKEESKMDLNLIKKLIRLIETSAITDLEVEENGFRVKIAKKIRVDHSGSQKHVVTTGISEHVVQAPQSETPSGKKEEVKTNLHEIRSPIVGTFYRAPAPDADNYVHVNDSVSPGVVLCIVEAMKLMNEIECDVSGRIIKILVENGKPVEYNQPLFLIETD
jgi:acetyl-CoA carboxylase biotin carboxyl carrier protein